MKQQLRILHLEDNKQDAELIHEKLVAEAIECEVTLVETREDFVSAIEQGGFDIILADYKLPSFDGISALKIANEKCPEVPFVFISGTMGEDTAVEALKSGATDYIIKDRLSRLAPAVSRAMMEAADRKELRKAGNVLQKSEERLRDITFSMGDWVWEVDDNGVYTYSSEKGSELLSPVIGKTPFDFMPPDEAKRVAAIFSEIVANKAPIKDLENWNIGKNGERICLLTNGVPILDQEGNLQGYRGVDKDITERKKAEADILKLNRTLRTISACNEALMRAKDEAALLEDICRIVVESGGYTSAWVGYAEQDEHKTVRPVAQRGFEPEYVSRLNITWADTERGRGPAGKAIRTGEPCLARNILSDQDYLPWRDMALRHGYSSLISLPLLSDGRVLGALSIYSSEPDPFHEEEVQLLSELAGDLSYGIITLRGKAELGKAYERIKEEAEVSDSLLQIMETLNATLDEKSLIQNVTKITPHYLKFNRVAVFLYDENIKGFTFASGYGLTLAEEGFLLSVTFKKGDFPAIDMIVNGETVFIENATETDLVPKDLVAALKMKSTIMVPIAFKGGVMGAIIGDYEAENALNLKDLTLLKGLADGIGMALQNSRLYKESMQRLMQLSEKIETIRAMAQLDKEILSSIDRTSILRTVTSLISRIIACDRVAVVLMEGNSFIIASEWGTGEFLDKTYSIKGSHCDAFRTNTVPLFRPDIAQDDCPYHKEQSLLGIRSVILVPIVTKKGVIGFLDIGSIHYGKLTPADLSTAENIASQVAVALENARLYEDLQQLVISTITSLASAVDAKSPWTNGHSERVTKYAVEIGKKMGLNEQDLERLRISGLLHDVGKIGTYDIVLDKPGKLTDEEFALVKKHPGKGAEILGPIKQLIDVIPGVLYHHERYDGEGYPDGLKGEEIPLQARILCVADSFDSMTADRPYRPSPGKEYAISELKRCSETQFDPKVAAAFLKVLDSLSI